MRAALRYHLLWLMVAVMLMVLIGLIYPNVPLALLGLTGLLIPGALATLVEYKIFVRRNGGPPSLKHSLKFSFWCGGLAFPMFFVASATLLWTFVLLQKFESPAQVPVFNFWVVMKPTPSPLHNSSIAVPVVFVLTLVLHRAWAYIFRVYMSRTRDSAAAS